MRQTDHAKGCYGTTCDMEFCNRQKTVQSLSRALLPGCGTTRGHQRAAHRPRAGLADRIQDENAHRTARPFLKPSEAIAVSCTQTAEQFKQLKNSNSSRSANRSDQALREEPNQRGFAIRSRITSINLKSKNRASTTLDIICCNFTREKARRPAIALRQIR